MQNYFPPRSFAAGGASPLAREIPELRHRADIDGLRAIAILGVLAYHLGLGGVTGGYGGVDVFFVISGYLITLIIKSEIDDGTFSLARFYERRIRRILPAFVAMAMFTSLLALLFLFPDDLATYGRSLKSAVVSMSNVHFAKRTGYFDGEAIEKPLLHTWSLGIEEQFYLVFPLLLLLMRPAGRRPTVCALAVVAIASIVFSQHEIASSPARAFFSMRGRAWELLVGCLLAFDLIPFAQNKIVRQLEAAVGLGAILAAYFFFSDATPFPGLAALPLCLGAALIIHAGSGGGTAVGRLLSTPPLVGIGLISYSLYLFHWPLLVFAHYRFGDATGTGAGSWRELAVGAVAIAISYLSYRFIEQPFRRSKPISRVGIFAGAAVSVAAIFSLAQFFISSHGLPDRWSPEIARMIDAERITRDPRCVSVPAATGWPEGVCKIGDGQPDTLLFGDSHAYALIPGVADWAKAHDRSIFVAALAGCPPLPGIKLYGRPNPGACGDRNRKIVEAAKTQSIKRIVLASNYGTYLEGRFHNPGGGAIKLSPDGANSNAEVYTKLLKATVSDLSKDGREVVLVGQIPEQTFYVGRAYARWRAWGQPLPEEVSLSETLERMRHSLPLLKELDEWPDVRAVYPHLVLCDMKHCAAGRGSVPFYYDSNHLSPSGTEAISKVFDEIFALGEPL